VRFEQQEALMTFVYAYRRSAISSIAFAAILLVQFPDTGRAECNLLLPTQAEDPAARQETTGRAAAEVPAPALETTSETPLSENAWDFTDPDSIPGFASTPYGPQPVSRAQLTD